MSSHIGDEKGGKSVSAGMWGRLQFSPPAASPLPQQAIWCREHQHSQSTSEATICTLLFISNSEDWNYQDTGPVSGFL